MPSIVIGDGVAFTASGFSGVQSIRAFRLGGEGDLGETNLVWEQGRYMPHIPSFVYVRPHLFTISESGMAMCLDAGTGEIVWRERVNGTYSASPVAAEGRIYLLADDGETTVIEAAPAFRVLARNPLGEKCQASIAVSGGQLFIRAVGGLYCIGSGAAASP